MERFCMNTAKSFLGKNVNLHLKDGSVIINVLLMEIQKDDSRGENLIRCIPYGRRNELKIPLRSVDWAELLNLSLMMHWRGQDRTAS
jgi:hypothetical protein